MGGTTIKSTSLKFLFLYVVFFLSTNTYTCIVVGLNSGSSGAGIKCIEKERHALLMIKKDLVDEYGHLSSWGDQEDQKDCCNWRGIKCDNRTHYVTMLDLHVSASVWGSSDYAPLRGKISPSLLELQHLNYLDLSYNGFGGSQIPAFIGSLTKLRYLNLSNAQFVGTIPYQLGNLSSLQFLDLKNGNFFQTSSENLAWLSHLSSLRYLDMSSVNLEKAVDWIQTINILPSIVDLRLQSCHLSSVVPPHLSLFNSSSSLSVLGLSRNSFTSEIYHWLFNFVGHSLVDLDLSYNRLEGPMPDAFENMTSLAHLDLSWNLIGGGIPKSLGNLLHLQTLDMTYNRLDENLPEIAWNLSGHAMNTLEILDLRWNIISGYVPDITIFSSLKELRLSSNNLNGPLPRRFENHSKLEVLDMSLNQIKGSLPDLSVFSSLRKLYLSHNKINGSLPESIGQLSELDFLDVSSNKLQGSISQVHFSTLTKLNTLDLSDNSNLILDVSSEWLPPFQLDTLKLGSVKLGWRFPVWLQNQRNVSNLDLSITGISDVIPNWFWDLGHNSLFLNLSHNNIKGILPDLSSKFSSFLRIDLRSNHLEGPIPLFPSNTISLDLSKNRFKGPISVICSIIGGGLNYLDLSDNLLSGKLPDCWRQWKELTVLNLANNQFDGEIPSSMGSLQSMKSLHLEKNRLTGKLPSSLQNCTDLLTMDVGENNLAGKLPAWIGEKLSNLIVLILRSNEFYGSIPIQLCYLQSIQLLDISLNSITGTIPNCFYNFTAIAQNKPISEKTISVGDYYISRDIFNGVEVLTIVRPNHVDYALFSWKGRIFEFGNTLGLVKSIDLSSNKLIGEIPLGITNLSGLLSLNLSRNNLVGLVPLDIGHLRMLEILDLSRNRFFGEIPGSMSNLNFLSFLNLSQNNLSGKIPSGTQLQRFEASSFAGNLELCGPPLTEKCPGEHTNQDDAHIQEDEDEFFVLDKWFYTSIALGFIVGFWGVCGTLVLHRSWRHAYFRFFDNSKDWLYVRIVVHTARMRRKIQSRIHRFL